MGKGFFFLIWVEPTQLTPEPRSTIIDIYKVDRLIKLVSVRSLWKVDPKDEYPSAVAESVGDTRGDDEEHWLLHLLDRRHQGGAGQAWQAGG